MEGCPTKLDTAYEFIAWILCNAPGLLGWVVVGVFVYGTIKLGPGALAALKESSAAMDANAEAIDAMNAHVSGAIDENTAAIVDLSGRIKGVESILARAAQRKRTPSHDTQRTL